MADTVYNGSNAKHIRRRVKVAQAVAERNARVLGRVMSLPDGREWMHELCESCHVFDTSFSDSAIRMAFAEGERNVGLQLFLGVVEHCPDEYLQMMREAYGRRTSDGQRRLDPDSGRYIEQPVDPAVVDSDYDPYDAEA